ncbi:MAG: transaldolase family protein, partial [Solirubrobacteraceae bacterium]
MESLIGPETINTLPPTTLSAFRDHGRAQPTLVRGLHDADSFVNMLPGHGVDLDAVCQRLQDDGVAAFVASWDKLKQAIAAKRSGRVR